MTSPAWERWFSGRVARRLPRTVLGVTLFGSGIALMARARLGLGPWAVLHEGLGSRLDLQLGTVDLLLSIGILAMWLPLRQSPGIGTIAAGGLIGLSTNLGMALVPNGEGLIVRVGMLATGAVVIAVGSGLYLAADLGPGPRDGLMTGLHQWFGWSLGRIRTGIELSVLCAGWLLGGTVGVGTVIFAVVIGPLVQLSLRGWDTAGAVLSRPREI